VNDSTVLLDYGLLARPGEPTDGPVGRVDYMAPEQWDGGRLSPAADWYSVGLLLFEALTGALPFSGTAQEVLLRKRTVGAPSPSLLVPGVPQDLDTLCAALLRSSPELRPDGAAVVATLRAR
jgi:serine/threonine protein kinase